MPIITRIRHLLRLDNKVLELDKDLIDAVGLSEKNWNLMPDQVGMDCLGPHYPKYVSNDAGPNHHIHDFPANDAAHFFH